MPDDNNNHNEDLGKSNYNLLLEKLDALEKKVDSQAKEFDKITGMNRALLNREVQSAQANNDGLTKKEAEKKLMEALLHGN